jgi:hypothetical protein
MSIHRILALGVGVFVAFAHGARADFVTLFATKQNTLVQVQPGSQQLSNGQGDIFVGRTAQDGQGPATISIRRGLIDFDIAGSVPKGSIITGATLTMWDVRGLNGSQTVGLHRVLADWGQGSSFFNGGVGGPAAQNDATWFARFYNASNPAMSALWTNPGGDFSSTISGTTLVTGHPTDVDKAFSWLGTTNPGMIADLQSWLDHPSANFGWLLEGNEAMGQTAKRFSSAEGSNVDFRPTLEVTFRAAPEPSSLFLATVGGLALAALRRRPFRT